MGKSMVASISLPEDISKEIDQIAKVEHKTKSGIIQDAVRGYIEQKKWRELQMKVACRARKLKIESDADIEKLVAEVRS